MVAGGLHHRRGAARTTSRARATIPDEDELRVIAESLPHIVFMAAADGSTEYFNRRGTEYTGLPPEANYGWAWVNLVHPDDAEMARSAWEQAVLTGTPFELDYRIRRRDGLYRWHAFRGLPVRDADGAIVKWIGTGTDIEEQRRSHDELLRIDSERRSLLRRLVGAQEEERRRIAEDIHDDSLQVLGSVNLALHRVLGHTTEAELVEGIGQVQETVRAATERLRLLVFNLRPAVLDRDGIAPALAAALQSVRRNSELTTALEVTLAAEPEVEVRTTLYRIAQEALSNVQKHAHATHVSLRLSGDSTHLRLEIADDGVGFDASSAGRADSLGLLAMQERAEMVGGDLEVLTSPGAGTAIMVTVRHPDAP